MSNSSLVTCTVKSPNHSGARTHSIDRITPHCVVGQLSASSIGGCFTSSSRQASCNYGIGTEGGVCLVVDECNRSWCTSSNANDQRAVTIECASDKTEPYAFNTTVYNKLVDLCTDICKRNGKTKLIWIADKTTALAYEPKSGEMLLTVHRWFANKSCPGNWMYARMGNLASAVTARLGGSTSGSTSSTSTGTSTKSNTIPSSVPFSVRVLVTDLNIRTEGSMSGKIVGTTGKGTFSIVTTNSDGWGKLKSGAGWIYLKNPEYVSIVASTTQTTASTTTKTTTSTTKTAKDTTADAKVIWDYLMTKINNAYGVAGLMGNIYAESGLISDNLQNTFNTKLGMTDTQYTDAVDNGSYTNFVKDSAGYGLCQWTYWSRKQALKNYADSKNASIGNRQMQLEFLMKELTENYPAVLTTLKSAKSVLAASNTVLLNFERPANQSTTVQNKRASYGQVYYDNYAAGTTTSATKNTTTTTTYASITKLQDAASKDTLLNGKLKTYKTTSDLNLRYGPSSEKLADNKTSKYAVIVTIPENTTVNWYGCYTKNSKNEIWKYIQVIVSGKTYTGFVLSTYLK